MLRGGFYTPPSMSSELLVPCAEADPIESLTPREKSELILCAQGYTMKEIASVLHISVKTSLFGWRRVFLHTQVSRPNPAALLDRAASQE